ncbi:hypothetical protein BJ684DRAFT_17768 [Piptocephalis cylindrospora]|uniref:Calcineurin-like phosphoesterase domain-containing protein n=1 Tax=Piptocephalis cylindrospora TaxID=1907219 RepID=A0A4P9XZT0_9FUNG|nr:hypothetical protein BJ684DRAFT_17768 [Piptocephalis cylindrospora]|eukprot:RKP11662.1 hypothetical protein BJ684DRAFT_17768 [Piptocephalis cylindrospora]
MAVTLSLQLQEQEPRKMIGKQLPPSPKVRFPSSDPLRWKDQNRLRIDRSFLYQSILFPSLLLLLLPNLYLYFYTETCTWGLSGADIKLALFGDPQIEGNAKLAREPFTGWLDLAFNDAYIQHIYTRILRTLKPTHAIVMGDLFSSQYIMDDEFELRAHRLNQAFAQASLSSWLIRIRAHAMLGRVDRFVREFGPVNAEWVEDSGVRVVVVNSMALESAVHGHLKQETWEHLWVTSQKQAQDPRPLLLLSHIPLYKPEGVCFDPPEIHWVWGYVSSQTQLTPAVSQWILRYLQPTWILAGHDHEGCMTRHRLVIGPDGVEEGHVVTGLRNPWPSPLSPDITVVADAQELTVRSMMGDYGGYTGLLAGRKAANGGINVG